jgi:hypothetical protein
VAPLLSRRSAAGAGTSGNTTKHESGRTAYIAVIRLYVSEHNKSAQSNMIRRGRQEGWLKEPIESLPRWATFHGVNLNHVKIGPLPGFEERGSTVIASRELQGGSVEPLLVVPKDLIISRANIELFARADRHLRGVLEAIGEFGRVRQPSGAMRDLN